MKKWIKLFCPSLAFLLLGCSVSTKENSPKVTTADINAMTTIEVTTETKIDITESSSMVSVDENVPLIYTSTEILSWSNPVDPLDKGLVQIISELKKEQKFIDLTEYLFVVSLEEHVKTATVEVLENYADNQSVVGVFSIDYETGEIELLEKSE